MNPMQLRIMGTDCISLIKRKMSKEMTREQFYLELMELHKKYPMEGHNPSLTPFQLSHYRIIQQVCTTDKGVKCLDHLQPFNFQEAGEMFIRHWQRVDEKTNPPQAWKRKEWPLTKSLEDEPELTSTKAEDFERKRQ